MVIAEGPPSQFHTVFVCVRGGRSSKAKNERKQSMPLSVTEVGGSGPSIEEGQYDLTLQNVELIQPKEGTDFGPQILLSWRVEEKQNPDGSPFIFRDYVNKKWGAPEFHSELRKRTFTMTSGRVNKFVEAILADTPGAIDLEWFIGTQILGEIQHHKRKTGGMKAVIANSLVERANADAVKNAFLNHIKTFDLELYNRCAAVAGLPIANGAAAPARQPVAAGASRMAQAAAPVADDSSDEELPF